MRSLYELLSGEGTPTTVAYRARGRARAVNPQLVWLGVLVFGLLMVGLEFLGHRAKGVEFSYLKVVFNTILLLAGIFLLFKAGKIAAHITDEDDDDEGEDEPPIDPTNLTDR